MRLHAVEGVGVRKVGGGGGAGDAVHSAVRQGWGEGVTGERIPRSSTVEVSVHTAAEP